MAGSCERHHARRYDPSLHINDVRTRRFPRLQSNSQFIHTASREPAGPRPLRFRAPSRVRHRLTPGRSRASSSTPCHLRRTPSPRRIPMRPCCRPPRAPRRPGAVRPEAGFQAGEECLTHAVVTVVWMDRQPVYPALPAVVGADHDGDPVAVVADGVPVLRVGLHLRGDALAGVRPPGRDGTSQRSQSATTSSYSAGVGVPYSTGRSSSGRRKYAAEPRMYWNILDCTGMY